jgi:hypothetical protein
MPHNKGIGRAPYAFANLPRGPHPKIEAWPSRLGLRHEADNAILEKRMSSKPKKDAGMIIGKTLQRRNGYDSDYLDQFKFKQNWSI